MGQAVELGQATASQRSPESMPAAERCELDKCDGSGWFEVGENPVRRARCLCSVYRSAREAVPARFQAARLKEFDEQVQEKCDGWMTRMGDGLFVTGEPGTGKTHLVCALLIRLCVAGKLVRFKTAAQVYRSLRVAMKDPAQEAELMGLLCGGPAPTARDSRELLMGLGERRGILCLDDIGSGAATDFERRTLLEILDSRSANLLVTVVTSNLGLEKIAELMDDRIASRLSAFARLELMGEDRRVHEIH